MPLPSPIKFEHDVVPFTTFRASLATFIDQTRRTHRPILVTQNGKSAAVLLSPADYDKAVETLALMADIRAAEDELDRGEALTPAEVESSLRSEGLL